MSWLKVKIDRLTNSSALGFFHCWIFFGIQPALSELSPVWLRQRCILTSEEWGYPVPDTAVHHVKKKCPYTGQMKMKESCKKVNLTSNLKRWILTDLSDSVTLASSYAIITSQCRHVMNQLSSYSMIYNHDWIFIKMQQHQMQLFYKTKWTPFFKMYPIYFSNHVKDMYYVLSQLKLSTLLNYVINTDMHDGTWIFRPYVGMTSTSAYAENTHLLSNRWCQ